MRGTRMQAELRTTNAADRIALRGVHLHARLSGMSQKTTIEQTFVNLEPRAIEAVYTFPLPDGAAVGGFEVITGDHVLTGVIEESDKAVEQYEAAISEGHGAFIVEQDRPDVFTARVGNLKPRQAATIRLTYLCSLDRVDRSIRVAFPTTIAPRYQTATATDPIEAAIDGDALNPPHVLCVPYGLSMEVDVALGRELARVSSPSHAIEVINGDDGACRATFAGGVSEMDRDVVLLLELKREHAPAVQAAPGREGETYLAVTFVPEFDESELVERKPAETVFVVDCSGSMTGPSIAQATAALELCLRSMSVGDTFNVCRFGSNWELLAPEPLVYSQERLDQAIMHIQRGANLGGTELYPPLEAILSVPPRAGTIRNVIVLTDGQVTNEPAVIELARKHRATNRIFAFGIGAAASSFLVKGLARATGGAAEFISAGERIDDKVLRTFGRLASPPVTDVTIDWDGCDVQTLAELPPVFDGDVLAVFGRAPARVPERVTLRCDTPTGLTSWSVDVPAARDDEGTIATMWARRTIQSLEEVNGSTRTRVRAGERTREAEMLIHLSKQFGLLCSLTTFIAIEHRSPNERNEGRPALRRVPVMVAAGWGNVLHEPLADGATVDKTLDSSKTLDRSMNRLRVSRGRFASFGVRPHKAKSFRESMRDIDRDIASPAQSPPEEKLFSWGATVPAAYSPPSLPREEQDRIFEEIAAELSPGASGSEDHRAAEVLAILKLQRADGAFGWKPVLQSIFQALGLDARRWRAGLELLLPKSTPSSQSGDIVSTVAILLLLSLHFPDQEPLWQRASRKASREFLPAVLGKTLAEVEALLGELSAKVPTASERTTAD
jgi:Ca-activated chloride channel homolog